MSRWTNRGERHASEIQNRYHLSGTRPPYYMSRTSLLQQTLWILSCPACDHYIKHNTAPTADAVNTVAFDLSDPPTTDLTVEHCTNQWLPQSKLSLLILTLFMCNAHGMPYTNNQDQKLTSLSAYMADDRQSVKRKPCGGSADGNVKSILSPVHQHRIYTYATQST